MAVIPVTRLRLHQIIWTLSTALRGRSFLSPAILRATRSTMMGARTPSTPASNLTVYRIAWWWASSSSSSTPRKDRIDPDAQEQKENCQNADFHIVFLSVVCLVISFTLLTTTIMLIFNSPRGQNCLNVGEYYFRVSACLDVEFLRIFVMFWQSHQNAPLSRCGFYLLLGRSFKLAQTKIRKYSRLEAVLFDF